VRERAAAMIRTADLMRQRRDELAGIIIRESAKPWRSADADVCEAIDFLNYYARQAVALFEGQSLGRYLLEHNTLFHRARGVAAIISPWNFPLAICTGMTAAALVTGNTAIVKPAEQSSWIARVMVDLFHEAGVAESVVQWLPGRGEVVGAALSQDPRVAIIAFTGSRDVGVELQRIAGTTQPGQTQARRLICEMGGKNAIIVDTSADPDLAVLAVRESAFGYSGQKCSACSRVIVVGDGHDRFVERLAAATAALTLGDPLDPQTDLGPVIDDDAAAKIWQYIDIGRQEGTLVYAGQVPKAIHQHGHRYVPPHIFTGIRPEHRLAREEIFGPVLAVMHAQSFEQAVAMANDSQYRLTGGVISRTPSHLAYARQHFAVGNLYLNRTITGALVGRQPFGGFGMSGIGEKAGGPAYLRQFVDSTVCTENTFRSGFSPEVIDLTEKGPIPGM
jgi:RHH-type proline utilization regulon transcriptional repressor/proline dehydrogenase/delta 1-pyrroline-5-carboxylate dehydrogenase